MVSPTLPFFFFSPLPLWLWDADGGTMGELWLDSMSTFSPRSAPGLVGCAMGVPHPADRMVREVVRSGWMESGPNILRNLRARVVKIEHFQFIHPFPSNSLALQ